MTKEEILAMEAGGKLNAYVAQLIMGNKTNYPLLEGRMESFPKYSTDISFAWQVVDKLNELFPMAIVEIWTKGRTTTIKAAKCLIWENKGHIAEIDADTAPEAICKAALLAKYS